MDLMNISSQFTTKIVSKIISNIIKKKFGCDVKISLNEFGITIDEDAKIHLDLNAIMTKNELAKIIQNTGF